MNQISHKQAIKFINRRLDGMLTENQNVVLDEHLRSCSSCRTYADEMELMPAQLQNEFHIRWDAQHGPSENVAVSIHNRTQRVLISNRLDVALRTVAGAAVLAIMALVFIYVIPGMKTVVSNPPVTWSPTSANSAPLMIDPQSCKPSTLESVPGDLYGHGIVQNTSLVDGDFSYVFWLYCDPSLQPDGEKHLNAIAGLGLYASWRYNGPQVEGENQYHFEWEPNVPIGTTSWNGPFYKAASGAKLGVDLSKAAVQASIQQGTPIQFRVVIDSPLGHNGSVLSFNLKPSEHGYTVLNLHADRLNQPADGLIAFVATSKNGDLDIYTIHPDGSGLTNLTNDPEGDVMPAWSPDGRRIAFVSNRDGDENIYVMNADGSDVIRLTDDPDTDNTPVWSQDGTKIAYTSGNFNLNDTNIYVMDANGGNRHPVTEYSKTIVFPQAWSSDGRYILFNSGQILQGRVDGGEIKPITPRTQTNTDNYVMAKDGSTLSYFTECQEDDSTFCYRLRTIRRDDPHPDFTKWQATFKTPGSVCPIKKTATSMGSFIKWSPDQSKILFIFTCENDGWIYIANADGSNFRSLTNYPVIKHSPDNGDATGDWSPDGQSIVFLSALDGVRNYKLYTININDALQNPSIRPTELHVNASQIWSPTWQPTP